MPDRSVPDTCPPQHWLTDRILPENFLPMLAASSSGFSDGGDYAYEPRWEGLRVLAGLESSQLLLRAGTGQEASFWFPESAEIRRAAQPDWVLLDGEMVFLAGDRVDASPLKTRLRSADAAEVATLAAAHPAVFVVYDILRIGDSWLLDVTWEERRGILERTVVENESVRVSPTFAEGREAHLHARALGMEGVTGRRLRGRYLPGQRSREFLNIRPLEEFDVMICGWTEARAGNAPTLLLGRPDERGYLYVGHTAAGLEAEALGRLHAELRRRETAETPFVSPPRLSAAWHPPRWVRPQIGCRVRHHGWSEAGRLRAPVLIALDAVPGLAGLLPEPVRAHSRVGGAH
jgi:bifunctional non-homologous end joining protein LigD